MDPLYQELLEAALEALAKNKIRVDTLQSTSDKLEDRDIYDNIRYEKEYASIVANVDKVSSELYSRDVYSKDEHTKLVESILEDIRKLTEAINNVESRDVYDSKVYTSDIERLTNSIKVTGKDVEQRIEKALTSIPVPKDGKNGVDGVSGKDGKNGIDGTDGKNGADGVGVDSIHSKGNVVTFSLSNGVEKTIELSTVSNPSSVTTLPTEVTSLRMLVDTDVDKAREGDVLTRVGKKWVAKTPTSTVPGDAGAIERRAEIESMFKVAQSTAYKEITYSQGNITNIDVYVDSSKMVKLFSKIIGYNSGNISMVSITDEVNGGTLNKTMVYIDGNVFSVTSMYSV